ESAARVATAPRDARDLLDRALDLWTGEPLSGLAGDWAAARRLRLSQWRVELLERRLRLDIELDEVDTAVTELTQLCNHQPLRESARRLLMLALYRTGRQAEALRTFEAFRDGLTAEPDAAPGTEISELYRAILRADDVLARPVPPLTAATRVPTAPTDLVGRADQLTSLRAVLRPHPAEP